MKYHRIIAAVLAAATLFTGATALAAGTAADPLVTRSWLETVFHSPLNAYVRTAADTLQATLSTKTEGIQAAAEDYARKRVAEAYAQLLGEAVLERASELMAGTAAQAPAAGMEQRTLKKGDRVTGPTGASVMFVSGAGKVVGPAGSEIINITAGGVRQPGPAIRTGILYMMAADDGSGIEVTSDTAVVLIRDGARAGYEPQYTACADALKLLGLFQGSNKGYELERCPSRVEALIMLLRLLGEEQAALAGSNVTPFSDLTIWADGQKYVAYGYRMHYTNGMSATTFGPNRDSTLEQYLTFVLRALGYRDGTDFVWNTTSRDLALELGLLTSGELAAIGRDGFRRDHVVLISCRALGCSLQDGSGTLAQRLMAAGVLTADQLQAAEALMP